MGIEGMDGLSLLFTSIASCELGHFDWPQSFPNFCRRTCPQCLWMPLNFLQHVRTLYLGSIWRLWMGIEGMDGVSLLFTAIASCEWAILAAEISQLLQTNMSPVPLDAAEFSAAC